ncbi:MAG: M14 family zinc carboxypeptidase [Candidatus Krumholzibacteriia bacterium]
MNSLKHLRLELRLRAGKLWFVVAAGILSAGLAHTARANDYREPAVDSVYAGLIREYTTDAQFLSPLVDHVPADPDVPSPRQFLGYIPGTPGRLTHYTRIKEYYEALAGASRNTRLFSIGKSNEGKEMVVMVIAEENVLDDLGRYAAYTRRLADPRVTTEADAESIIQQARPIYYITGGLHSTETGPPEMLMELAYRLAVGKSQFIERIRKHVITMITPVLETDGRERMVDWYNRYTKEHTDWDDMPPRTPPYWGKYIFHDNNRDGIQLSQPLTRNVARLFFDYHPQVMLDLHESVPLLYVSAGTGPYGPNLDPIVTSEWQWISNHEVTELTKFGMPGVWTWGFYTGWYPGYLLWWGNNHNSIGRFYETFGNAGATTIERELKQKFAGKEVTSKQWYRPWPPDKKVKWSIRNNTNYMQTGVLVSLDFVAKNGKSLLYNFWKKGANAVERGRTKKPYAWIVPADNPNKWELGYLVGNLRAQGLEVHRLEKSFAPGDAKYEKGDFVVRMDQPYRDLAKTLLEKQHFPKDADFQPYDDVAWTLPLLYGVEADEIDDSAVLDTPMSLVESDVQIAGERPKARRRAYLISASPTEKLIEARLMLGDIAVFAAEEAFKVGKRSYPVGSWIIPAVGDAPGLRAAVEGIADKLCIDVYSSRTVPDVPKHNLDFPRLAVFHTWTYTQDSGWVRFTLDRARVPYSLINKDQLRAGELRRQFDVILIPDLGRWFQPKQLVHGVDTKWGPMPYTASSEFEYHGAVDRTDDMTGGMGFKGLEHLESFIEEGGTLITLGAGSLIPVELGLVRGVDRKKPSGFNNPGSILRSLVTDKTSNILYGYGETPNIFRGNLPLFEVPKKYRSWKVLHYGTEPDEEDSEDGDEKKHEEESKKPAPICISGQVKGEKHLKGKPAILDIEKGDGRVVIFSFNPMHRYLTHASFGMVYNAIMNWND